MSRENLVEPKDPHPALPQLRLDDLLAERQARLQAVLDTRDRVYTLLEAVVAVGTNLDLETVLQQIVEAAITLVRARYGALGIIGEGGRMVKFVPVGLADDQIAATHHWPEGRGLLGALITDPRPLHLPDISASPKSSGFPGIQVLEVVDQMTPALGVTPSLRLVGPLDEAVPADAAEQLLSALREALSNAARHAAARRVDVTVQVGPELILRVRDDGTGMAQTTRRSGLANLAARAVDLGGRLTIDSAEGRGTQLDWRVPVS